MQLGPDAVQPDYAEFERLYLSYARAMIASLRRRVEGHLAKPVTVIVTRFSSGGFRDCVEQDPQLDRHLPHLRDEDYPAAEASACAREAFDRKIVRISLSDAQGHSLPSPTFAQARPYVENQISFPLRDLLQRTRNHYCTAPSI